MTTAVRWMLGLVLVLLLFLMLSAAFWVVGQVAQ
jgi:hypothetical protein